MRILVISDVQDIDKIKLQLKDLCEYTSISIINTIDKASDFINNHIVKLQLPLDLIIIYSTVNNRTANDFRDFIRNDYGRTFSHRDFYISTIPLIIVVESGLNKNSFNKYDLSIDDIGVDRLNLFANDFLQVIKNWRRRLLEELDYLGVKFNSGIIDYNTYFENIKKEVRPTKIISDNFKSFPRRLNYYWLDFNKEQIEKSIDEFIKMLNRSNTIGKKGEEKSYHLFFNKNKSFLVRDAYSKHRYEPKLYKNLTEFEEPDYTLKPNFTFETDLSLLEVKLPNEGFLTKSKFHTPLKSKLMRHIFQVNDYKEYLESDQYLSEINNVFGYIPRKVNYNILIGRQKDKEENIYTIEKRMNQLNQKHLNLMTYDELLEYQVKFLERMSILDIK